MWNNKAKVEGLQKFMKTYSNRYSDENIQKEFKDHDAALFNSEITFELDDCDRFEEVAYVHGYASKASSFTIIIAFIMLMEGKEGR